MMFSGKTYPVSSGFESTMPRHGAQLRGVTVAALLFDYSQKQWKRKLNRYTAEQCNEEVNEQCNERKGRNHANT